MSDLVKLERFTEAPRGFKGQCACGNIINTRYIRYDPIDCKCGRVYNLWGQELDAHAAHCYICGELGGDHD